jgi:hypothetical protein
MHLLPGVDGYASLPSSQENRPHSIPLLMLGYCQILDAGCHDETYHARWWRSTVTQVLCAGALMTLK